MKRKFRAAALVLSGCLTMGSIPAAAGEADAQEAFNQFLDRVYVETLNEDPFFIHFSLEHPETYGITIDNYTLADYTEYDEDAIQEYLKEQEAEKEELLQFDREQLTEQQKLLYDKLLESWEQYEKYADTADLSSMIGGSNGIVNSLANNFENYLFIEKKDVEDYLKFLADIPNYIDYAIEYTNSDAEYGITPSKYMLKVNLEYIDELINGDSNVFIDGFDEKLAAASFLTAEERNAFSEQNRQLVESSVNPAFEKLKAQLEEWQNTLDEWVGLAGVEGGDAYYEYLIEQYAGVSMGAEALYDYLSEKLDESADRMIDLMQDDTVYDHYINWDYGFPDLSYTEILDGLRDYTQETFAPIQDPGYQVSELPDVLRSDSVLAYYLTPQDDNDETNLIFLNPDTLGDDPGMLYVTLAHEGYPGHLYYSNYIKQQGWHPLNGLISNLGYTEGWADYAAELSLDHWDCYDNMAEVVFLDQEINYLLSAMTDIGINYSGWTVDDVFDLWNNYFELDSAEDVQDMYDGFLAEPAVILSYPVGYFQIRDLEADVQELLGDAYDHDAFVEAFLSVGGASFDLTREYVMNWANEQLEGAEVAVK